MTEPLRVAAAQFPVSADIGRNGRYVRGQIREARDQGAQVVHFPEAALSGYAPSHGSLGADYPWRLLEDELRRVRETAAEAALWVVVGSNRQVQDGLPRNSTLVIAPDGAIAGHYDKRRLYGNEKDHYTPGDQPLVLEIGGHRCGFLICYDNCYPELFEGYRQAGVAVLFLSLYNAGRARATTLTDLMRANLIVRAADHGFWISASNSSRRYSALPASIARPDGSMVQARRNVSGIVVDEYPPRSLGWTYDNRRF